MYVATAARELDFVEFRRCARISYEQLCTSNLARVTSQLNSAVSCNNVEFANLHSNTCARDNQTGLYCGAAMAYSLDIGRLLFGTCASTLLDGNCTPECQNSLTSVSNSLGCCINAIFNITDGLYSSFGIPAFSYALWSSCGVEPPDIMCEGTLDFILPSTPEQEQCDFSEISGCNPTDLDTIRKTVADDPGCDTYLDYFMDLCSFDEERGTYCAEGNRIPSDTAMFLTPITTTCSQAKLTQMCSSECRQLLESFIENRGCCANTIYNSTYATATGVDMIAQFLDDSTLFELCGVDAPPLTCTSKSGSLPLPLKCTLLILVIIALLFGSKM